DREPQDVRDPGPAAVPARADELVLLVECALGPTVRVVRLRPAGAMDLVSIFEPAEDLGVVLRRRVPDAPELRAPEEQRRTRPHPGHQRRALRALRAGAVTRIAHTHTRNTSAARIPTAPRMTWPSACIRPSPALAPSARASSSAARPAGASDRGTCRR